MQVQCNSHLWCIDEENRFQYGAQIRGKVGLQLIGDPGDTDEETVD